MKAPKSTKRKIALYGGTFNPPTMGHRLVIEEVLNSGVVDHIWVLPSLGLFKKNSIAYAHRMRMCEIAFSGIENVSVSSLELALGETTAGYTFNVIEGACKTFPEAEFYFILGGDTAEVVQTKWYRGQELIDNQNFITLPRLDRNGLPINTSDDVWYRKSPHIYLGDINQSSISSSQVRDLYKRNSPMQLQFQLPFLIDKNVRNYINEFAFYKEDA